MKTQQKLSGCVSWVGLSDPRHIPEHDMKEESHRNAEKRTYSVMVQIALQELKTTLLDQDRG